VKNNFDLPKDHVYARSLEVAKKMGAITLEDRKNGVIEAEIEEADVKITVKQVTRKSVELKVKARDKVLVPKVEVAQKVYTKIIEKF